MHSEHAAPPVDLDNEPISPELALVCPELAAHARQRLPPITLFDPTARRSSAAMSTKAAESPQRRTPLRARRSWRRPLIAATFFVAGAGFGAYVAGDLGQPRVAPSSQVAARPATRAQPTQSNAATSVPAPLSRSSGRPPRRGATTLRAPVPSVLGVVATSGGKFIRLKWQRPRGAVNVAVFRISGRRRVLRYKGSRTSFTDRSVRRGRSYRYVLLSYDRAGRSSSGVVTVVAAS